jgi:hypothetical protein
VACRLAEDQQPEETILDDDLCELIDVPRARANADEAGIAILVAFKIDVEGA